MSSALASLTADYTDSEEEHEDSPEKQPGIAPSAATAPAQNTPQPSGSNQGSAVSTPTKTNKTRLVSYVEEDGLDESKTEGEEDDDDNDKEASNTITGESMADAATASAEDPGSSQVVPMDLDSDQDNSNPDSQTEAGRATRQPETDHPPNDEDNEEQEETLNSSTVEVEAWSGGVQLPPEPAGMCDPRLQKSIQDLYKRKMERGFDMNAYIQQKKSFRNPSIYEKLIEFCGIDEHGTNFPKDLYDGHLFGQESYYEELRKVQDADIERREKAAKKSKSDAASSASIRRGDDSNSASSLSTTKRRSKWDQAAPSVAPSGALAKTISAFGPLKK
ncbi:hypothetical protein TCAL_00514 [Tigriopus californicus]|uniref:SAP30-binding protein n=2 Tax=Tigriopus californicus TaxID=6832 RepID=A0A553PB41_TIGCA|nr:hypothetical protein TCAL_00514 [Tigriopus californicus]|eukprot:TCALIF_00514-PA protein Name:"Similar to SAP30BP SAP30-binding protein (Homo sapiens)" AED:0.56 eAED:0.56 QI:0/-1/0/1/-1/1/1/0/332